jgi:hypothetical protein
MTIKTDKKLNIDDENVLCMIWVNLNIVQYMITTHTIDEMQKMIFHDAKRRNEMLKSIILDEKLSFSISIVEYNRYIRNRTKMLSKDSITHLIVSIVDTDDRFSSFC